MSHVVRLGPYQYVHVQDNNSNVTRVLVGPLTYTLFDHEVILQKEPLQRVCIPADHYAVIENPVARANGKTGDLLKESNGQIKVRQGDSEIRFAQEPFPLYPGESLGKGGIQPLKVLDPLSALKLRATRTLEASGDGKTKTERRVAGDEWLFRGPGVYVPETGIDILQEVKAITLLANQAAKLRAKSALTDDEGVQRNCGEEWMMEKPGAYIAPIEAEIVEVVNAVILTPKKAVHVEALSSFKDKLGKDRKAGQKWLITKEECPVFMPGPQEKVIAEVPLTSVGARQYCVVHDMVDSATGKNCLGEKTLRKGQCNFFLHPGETLDGNKPRDILVLGANEALKLSAVKSFDDHGTPRKAGDRWMLRGPCDYIPPIQVEIADRRKSIPLNDNEGVYIRNVSTGLVRAHIGSTIMLNEDEELWEKPLSSLVEELLVQPKLTKVGNDAVVAATPREKHKVVSCNVPHNAVIQVYDYKKKAARVIRGPESVRLNPDEEFTVVSLSGKKPKQSDYIKALGIFLGPDFMTDIIIVETSDHARLQLQLSYNWEFDTSLANLDNIIFTVPDFVGDACKAIASRIRGFVASSSFDEFHKNSAQIIQVAVFGKGDSNVINFKSNGLMVTGVDIHSVDPVDPKTREALTKSVQLAIEITTKSQEAAARQLAVTAEQEAKGRLERQIIKDQTTNEISVKELCQIVATNSAIETCGATKAQARAQAEAKLIEGQTAVDLAQKIAESQVTASCAELEVENLRRMTDLEHRGAVASLEVNKKRRLAEIETLKFEQTIEAIGKDTIKALAVAGPELQAKLLAGMGLQGYLVTDGTNPINLFNTAKGMTAPGTGAAAH